MVQNEKGLKEPISNRLDFPGCKSAMDLKTGFFLKQEQN